jgi:hypothetical protein
LVALVELNRLALAVCLRGLIDLVGLVDGIALAGLTGSFGFIGLVCILCVDWVDWVGLVFRFGIGRKGLDSRCRGIVLP